MDIIAIIAAIIFGIISFLTGREDNKSKPVAKPSPTPSGPDPTVSHSPSPIKESDQNRQSEDVSEREDYGKNQDHPVYMNDDITQNREAQKLQPNSLSAKKRRTSNPIKSPISMKEQFNQKRLAESIIMSEVLGPPRAHKPYRPNQYRKNY
ncbi:hypothetical protein SAMN05421676_106160 [Salinibacillus kushneri]|uniref:Uncharacterized protein n=1 Tax=Salinibacillus kushneri TaxID=237682 RepID=A0A1I0FZU9_9BACI|nr:hypothetical protein [Salinibacillus kushneri]SET63935.1 hypothetical protein SAMN05421676_106160 [Salinibacillus kushneri]